MHQVWISYSKKKYRLVASVETFLEALRVIHNHPLIGSDKAKIIDLTTKKPSWLQSSRTK